MRLHHHMSRLIFPHLRLQVLNLILTCGLSQFVLCHGVVLSLQQHDGRPYCHKPCYAALFGPKGKIHEQLHSLIEYIVAYLCTLTKPCLYTIIDCLDWICGTFFCNFSCFVFIAVTPKSRRTIQSHFTCLFCSHYNR